MGSVVDAQAYQLLRPAFIATYVLWGVVWTLVAFHYGRAAFAGWRAAGGSWRTAVHDVAAPFTWAVKDQLCRWRLARGAGFCGAEIPSPYQRGDMLRFAIFLGSLTPVVFGFYFVNLDRSGWSYGDVVVNLVCVLTSCLAAGGHLFLAYRGTPAKWRRLVVAGVLWCALAPPLLYWTRLGA